MSSGMPIDYLAEFPIPVAHRPARLRALLEPVGMDPSAVVVVAEQFENDPHGPDREHVLLNVAVVAEGKMDDLCLLAESSSGLVEYSTPVVDHKGDLGDRQPSISGHGYIVAAWGDSSWFAFNLSESVWMMLGLSPRLLGSESRRVVYDDLSKPDLGIAEGEVSSSYYYTRQGAVRWRMRNDYLRRYLWMRGAWGVRAFYYQCLLPEAPELLALLNDQPQVVIKPPGGWFEVDLRQHDGGLLLQAWATVAAISPETCVEPTADGLVWPGFEGPVTHDIANALVGPHFIYLDDRFLERYEQDPIFETRPFWIDGRWHCSPSYRGQWSFTDCVRVGRNVIRVPLRELYKPKPDREILHAHDFALTPAQVQGLDLSAEPIIGKVQRLTIALIGLADGLEWLSKALGLAPLVADDVFKLSPDLLEAEGVGVYPELRRLGQVAPQNMSAQAFTARCKSLFEIWNRAPLGPLKRLLEAAGHSKASIEKLGSLKLLQALLNLVERLNAQHDSVGAFASAAEADDLTRRNPRLASLFIANDLRIADAHEVQDKMAVALKELGIDPGEVANGYGFALDVLFDGVIGAAASIVQELTALSKR